MKKFNRADFSNSISEYSVRDLLNCICVIMDRLLPLNETPAADFKWMTKFLSKLVSHMIKHTTHYPD